MSDAATLPRNDSPMFFIRGRWEPISFEEIEACRRANPDDWQLAWLNRAPWKYRLAVQAIARAEERYLKEWITYHLRLGVERIFLYDNNDKDGVDAFLKGVLSKADYDRVEVIPWHEPMDFQQREALRDCVEKHKHDVEWLLSIDVDEFLVIEKRADKFLDDFSDASEIVLSWESFNASGQLKYEDRPVMERFTETFECRDFGQGKALFRPCRLRDWYIHGASLTKGRIVDSLHREIVPPRSDLKVFEVAWVKHYFTKSLEEWVWKIRRGCCDSLYCRKYAQFFEANPDMMEYYDHNEQASQKHSLGPEREAQS